MGEDFLGIRGTRDMMRHMQGTSRDTSKRGFKIMGIIFIIRHERQSRHKMVLICQLHDMRVLPYH